MALYGITEENLRLRREFMGFGDEDVRVLAQLYPWAREHGPRIAKEFYDVQFSFPETRGFFERMAQRKGMTLSELRASLERTQLQYFLDIFEEASRGGNFGVSYFSRRLRIGSVHNAIDLPMKWYIGSYGIYVNLVVKHLQGSFRFKPGFRDRALNAIVKVFIYDMQSVFESFFFDFLKDVDVDVDRIGELIRDPRKDFSDFYPETKKLVKDKMEERARALKELISEVGDFVGKVAGGDLTARLEVRKGEYEELYRELNKMVSGLRDILSKTYSASSSLTDNSIILTDISYQLEKGIKVLNENVSAISTSAEEFSAIVQQNAQNTDEARKLVEEMASAFAENRRILLELISSMQDIYRSVEKYSEVIRELSSSVGRIGEITGTINSIAEQTSLLSLNAAIEAARAGEAGRGFAVVADEVRKLAEKTSESAKDIINIIEGVSQSASRAVGLVQRILETVQRGMEASNRASESISDLAKKITEVDDRIAALATAGEEESTTANQLAHAVVELRSFADENRTRAEELKGLVRKTMELLTDMLKEIDRFNLDAFNIEKAKTAHNMWKLRLLKFLEGEQEISTSELVDHTQCYLGRWYYSQGKESCGHLESFKAIEQPHIELHRLAREIYELKNMGRLEEAEGKLRRLKEVASVIVSNLDRLKTECKRSG